MAQFNLNRAQGPQVPTLKLNEITPKNWHRFPPRVAAMNRANEAGEKKPRYDSMTDWYGGLANEEAQGGDSEIGTASSTAPAGAWSHQAGKAAALGTQIAPDVGKSWGGDGDQRGAIEPHEPYPSVNQTEVPPGFRDSNYISFVPPVIP